MTKFFVYAKEKIYYTKVVECADETTLRSMISNGEIHFENSDIADGEQFEVTDYEEFDKVVK